MILLLCFGGCSKDEEFSDPEKENGPIQFAFVGKWQVARVKIDNEFKIVTETCYNGSWFEFTDNYGYSSENKCSGSVFIGSYSRKGGTITCNVNGSTIVYKISGQEGKDKMDFDYTENGNTITMSAIREK